MVGTPQTYYFVLLEEQGNEEGISYDDTVYGITITVTLNSATDMTDVTIEESNYILKQTSESNGYIYYEVSVDNPELRSKDKVTIYPFVNTYSEFTDITVEKEWVDTENGYETRPESITVTVTGNDSDENTYTLTLNEGNSWKDTVSNLPVFSDDDSKITYTVTEESINGYTGQVFDNGDGSYTITNTLETVNLSGIKTWDDQDDKYELRPDDITIQIMNGEDEVTTTTATADNNWTWSVSGLPKYDSDGNEIEYTISEVTVPGYESEVDGYNIANSLETVDLSGTKTWDDQDNKYELRPDDITILIMNGEDEVTTTTATADDNWNWNVSGLPKYDSDGNEIEYTIAEVTVPGYESEVSGYNIANTLETIDITGTKTWDDANNRDGKRVTEITVNLLSNGEKIDSITVTGDVDANTWNWSFTDLPKYDSDGNTITYTVTEDTVVNYTTEITGSADSGFVITNSYEPGKVSLNVQKIWNDSNDSDGERPDDITVILVKNGEETDQTLTLNEDNDWSGTFEDLDEYTAGVKNEYSVDEAVAGIIR